MEGRRLADVSRSLVVASALWLGLAVLAPAAHAQCQHGASVFKTCQSPKRACTADAECDDSNPCTDDTCKLNLSNTTDCLLSFSHADTCGDTTRINEAFDIQDFGGDNVRVPAAGNLPISSVSGNAVCCAGPVFPCFVGPSGSNAMIPAAQTGCGDLVLPGTAAPGLVTVQQNTYVIQPDDPDPLPDQANFRVQDRCDVQPSGCSTGINTVQFTAATDLDSCSNVNTANSTPCPDTDGQECTTAGCDGQGNCSQTHVLVPNSTPCTDTDVDACTTSGCDGEGTCSQTHITCTTTSTSTSSTSTSSTSSTSTSSSTTTSSTLGGACGNGMIEPPETCDPPGSLQPPNNNPCRADCTYCGDAVVQMPPETCDDGNTVNGTCPSNQDECRNDCTKLICKDPARIRFRSDGPHEFKVHALIDPEPNYDPSVSTVKVELRNANGIIYSATLSPGMIPRETSSSFKMRDRAARDIGGFAYFQIIKRPSRASSITFKTYGDFSSATLSHMTLTVTIGGEEFRNDGSWRQLPNGWRMALNLRPVP